MVFCTRCGFEIPLDAKFCSKCGAKVEGKTMVEEFEVKANELVDKVKALIHEGNVRKIVVKDMDGKTFMEIPVTIGVIGVILAPILAAVGALAALAMNYKLVVERRQE